MHTLLKGGMTKSQLGYTWYTGRMDWAGRMLLLKSAVQLAVLFRRPLAQAHEYRMMLGCSSSFKEKMQMLQAIKKLRWGLKAQQESSFIPKASFLLGAKTHYKHSDWGFFGIQFHVLCLRPLVTLNWPCQCALKLKRTLVLCPLTLICFSALSFAWAKLATFHYLSTLLFPAYCPFSCLLSS